MTSGRARVRVERERFELRSPFRISRGTKTHAEVVVVSITLDDGRTAAGEGVPYARYGESMEGVVAALRAAVDEAERVDGVSLASLERAAASLSGAARNALDSALFAIDDPARAARALEGFDVLAGAGTLVVDAPERMVEAAASFRAAVMKVKLQGDGLDAVRLEGVHAARPDLPLWIDANEGLSAAAFAGLVSSGAAWLDRVILLEQPVRAGEEPVELLARSRVPVCADESFHTAADVDRVARAGYRAVNVKLDKAGGLRSALEAARAAHDAGLAIAVGCMVSTSLSIAPAFVLVKALRDQGVEVPFVDLDGATFLRADRPLAGTGFG